jgi:hypothetical protein
MDFPPSVTSGVITGLKPGQVIRLPVPFEDEPQPVLKRLIVLTHNNKETILAVTTTSNLFAPTRHFAKDDIYIEPGAEEAFEKPTYVNMNRVISLDTEKIIQLFTGRKVDILEGVSDELFRQILDKIRTSLLIEGKYCKRIISENNAS